MLTMVAAATILRLYDIKLTLSCIRVFFFYLWSTLLSNSNLTLLSVEILRENIIFLSALRQQAFTWVSIHPVLYRHVDGLVQKRRNSIATALELHLSCTNPSIWHDWATMSELMRFEQNGLRFAEDVLRWIFLNVKLEYLNFTEICFWGSSSSSSSSSSSPSSLLSLSSLSFLSSLLLSSLSSFLFHRLEIVLHVVLQDRPGSRIILRQNSDLADYCQPSAPGALLKASLLSSEVVSFPCKDTLEEQLRTKYGSGIELESWTNLPHGSGKWTLHGVDFF